MKNSMLKLVLISLVCVIIGGCQTLQSIASGGSSRTVTDKKGMFGQALYDTSTTSKSAEVFKSATEAISNLPDEPIKVTPPCGGITFAQMAVLSPSGQVAAMNCLAAAQSNRPMEIMGEAMMAMAGGPVSTAHAIFSEATKAVNSIQNASLGKWNAASSFGRFGIGVSVAGRTVRNGQNAQRDQSISASENSGDIAVGDVSVSSGQSIGDSSNDPSSGMGGSSLAETNSTATGSTDSPNIINIGGDGNKTFISKAEDSGRVFNDSKQNLLAEPSSSATQLNNTRSSGLLNADENNQSPLDSNDADDVSLF